MSEHGYTETLHREAPYGRGCVCPEDFDHDGKCQNATSGSKMVKCKPCSHGWHQPYPCNEFVQKGWPQGPGPFWDHSCNRCGWEDGQHPDVQARWRATERSL